MRYTFRAHGMLRRCRFYVSLLLGGGWTGENLRLQGGDARQSCSCGAGMAARALLRSRDAPKSGSCRAGTPARADPAGRGRPEEPFWRILATLLGQVIWGASIPLRGAVSEQMRLRGGWCQGKLIFWSKTSNSKKRNISRDSFNKLICVFGPYF
jgi:hypothetical protein